MELILMAIVIIAAIALGAFCKDRYDHSGTGSEYSRKGDARKHHRRIGEYDRRSLNHTNKH